MTGGGGGAVGIEALDGGGGGGIGMEELTVVGATEVTSGSRVDISGKDFVGDGKETTTGLDEGVGFEVGNSLSARDFVFLGPKSSSSLPSALTTSQSSFSGTSFGDGVDF